MSRKADERVSLDIDPEEALRALLKVDPDVESGPSEEESDGRDEQSDAA
jgi:hypothetical protein